MHSLGGGVIVADSLSVGALSKLDLQNNALIWTHGGASAFSMVQASICAAADSNPDTETPVWDKPGITSSLAAGNPVLYGLAYAMGSDLHAHGTETVAGQTFNDDDVLVMYTVRGDVAFDGQNDDFTSTAVIDYGGFGTTWETGDFHYFGNSDDSDSTISIDYGGQGISPASAPGIPVTPALAAGLATVAPDASPATGAVVAAPASVLLSVSTTIATAAAPPPPTTMSQVPGGASSKAAASPARGTATHRAPLTPLALSGTWTLLAPPTATGSSVAPPPAAGDLLPADGAALDWFAHARRRHTPFPSA
jgi:hypothetical protein